MYGVYQTGICAYKYCFSKLIPVCRGCQARSKAQDSGSCFVGIREFESRPLHLIQQPRQLFAHAGASYPVLSLCFYLVLSA